MMAKIVQGGCFRGVVNYVLDKKESRQLATKGLRTADKNSLISSFITQSKLNSIGKPVAHISLDFSAQDREKLTNSKMIEIAQEYMVKMGYSNTQVLMARHSDRDHPHLHLILNRIDFNGKRISDQNERIRSTQVCKELTIKHSLYFAKGKENVKRHRLREPDKAKYEIYDIMKFVIPKSYNFHELSDNLQKLDVTLYVKHRRGSEHVEDVSFVKDGCKFKGSEIDRRFSHAGLQKMFGALICLEEKKREEEQQRPKQRKKNPPISTVKGVKLTVEQWDTLKNGGYIYLDNLQSNEGKRFSSYIFTNDKPKRIFFSKIQPDTFVKYGKYEMREMDRRLIEAGHVTRATVKWWGNAGQLARPYLWKASPTDTEYQEAWSDPRRSEPQQSASPASIVEKSISPGSKATRSITDTIAETASALGGIFDISQNPSSDEIAKEAEFRRFMQRKKKTYLM